MTPEEVVQKLAELKEDYQALQELGETLETQLDELDKECGRNLGLQLSELEKRTLLSCLERLNLTAWEQEIYERIREL